jgi:agmatine/peptidylarginine deiminase
MRLPSVRTRIAFDGGNLLTNGRGLCLATTQLLERNREFGYPDKYVTATVQRLFGADETVYLEKLEGEKTGHVDLFAAFTAPDTVVVGDYSGVDPVNAAILDRNAERLSKVVTASGLLRVVRLPMPPRGGDDFGGSYTNVLFANGVLLVPSWPNLPRETEDRVMATYRRLLPDWDVVGIDVGNLMSHGGALRCVSLPLYRTRSRNGAARTHAEARQETPSRGQK